MLVASNLGPEAMCEMENAIDGVLKAKTWVAGASGELGKIVEEAQLPSTTAWGPNWGQDFKSGLHASKLCSPAFKKFLLEMNKNPVRHVHVLFAVNRTIESDRSSRSPGAWQTVD